MARFTARILLIFIGTLFTSISTHASSADLSSAFNELMLRTYQQARERTLLELEPYAIADKGGYVLTYKGRDHRFATLPEEYTQLKIVSHIVLGSFALFTAPEQKSKKDDLREFSRLLRELEPQIADWHLRPSQKLRQRLLISRTLRLLEKALTTTISSKMLKDFFHSISPYIDRNIADAAEAQIISLRHMAVQWKALLAPRDWLRLIVVVGGGKLPRANNLDQAFFCALLAVAPDDPRVIYAEGLGDYESRRQLLGTYYVDRKLGERYFADPTRMHRDLLGDVTPGLLKKYKIADLGRE